MKPITFRLFTLWLALVGVLPLCGQRLPLSPTNIIVVDAVNPLAVAPVGTVAIQQTNGQPYYVDAAGNHVLWGNSFGWVQTIPYMIGTNFFLIYDVAGVDGQAPFFYAWQTNISGVGHTFLGVANRSGGLPSLLFPNLIFGPVQLELPQPVVTDSTLGVGGTLAVNGGVSAGIVTTTTNLTLNTTHYTVRADATSSNLVLELPIPAFNVGRIYWIKKVDNTIHTVSVNPISGNIDFATNLVISGPGISVQLQSDGSNWNQL